MKAMKKMMMEMITMKSKEPLNIISEWCMKGVLTPFSTPSHELFCEVEYNKCRKAYSLYSKSFRWAVRMLFKESENEALPSGELDSIVEELELRAFQNPTDKNLVQRVYGKGRKLIYDLGAGKSVKVYQGVAKIIRTPKRTFWQSQAFKEQVLPNLDVDPTELPALLGEIFTIKDEKELLLITLYIVACFTGALINVPILLLSGEKGSAKSTTLKRIEQIVDPKVMGLGGAPRTLENLELRMHNSYFLTLDNLSRISQNVSDTLCRGCTGGSVTKRQLYSDKEEIIMDLKCIIAINGVSVVAKESDLIDRCIIYKLSRIPKEGMRTERELNREFEKLLPDILGCCFQLVAIALADKKPVKVKEKIRLSDFFDMAIKIGRALSYDDREIADILWENQRKVNAQTLEESLVAQCLLLLMEEYEEYKESMTTLLGDLRDVAECNHIHPSQMPKQPNQLSRQLNQVKENLAQEHGLYYQIRNVGPFKEIHIFRQKGV